MRNIYFPDEEIEIKDLYFICYMIERVARRIHQRNRYVVNTIGREALMHLISVASVLHCENPLRVEDDWIEEYGLAEGDFDITDVYQRLIVAVVSPNGDFVDGILNVYNNEICDTIDNYNCSAFYEPSYVIARAYYEGGF